MKKSNVWFQIFKQEFKENLCFDIRMPPGAWRAPGENLPPVKPCTLAQMANTLSKG